MSTAQTQQHKRVYWLDVARVLAIVCIVVCHATTRSFTISSGTLEELQAYGALFSIGKALLYTFSRLGVPLFLMITGALMLGRDYESEGRLERFFKHNWVPLVRTSVLWFGIMFVYLSLFHDSVLRTQGVGKAILRFFETLLFVNQVSFTSMWYMPMIIGLYLFIPLIAIGLKRLGSKYFLLLSGIAVVLVFLLPNLNAILQGFGLDAHLRTSLNYVRLFSIYPVYLLAGYWVRKGILDGLSTPAVGLGAVLSYLLTAGYQFWMYTGPTDYNLKYEDFGILLTSVFLFEFLRRKGNVFLPTQKVTEALSRYAFGMYCVHICVMRGLIFVFKHWHIELYPYVQFLLLFAVSFGLSWLIIALTEKVPFFRKYLYLIK